MGDFYLPENHSRNACYTFLFILKLNLIQLIWKDYRNTLYTTSYIICYILYT